MLRLVLAMLGALLLSATFAGSASAQCTTIHGSGCPGAKAAPHCVTPPQIGTAFSARCPGCSHDRRSFLALGTPLHTPIVIGPPLACGHQLCNLNCSLLAFLHAAHLQLHIPSRTTITWSGSRSASSARASSPRPPAWSCRWRPA
jgi:hypothetical protein